MDNETKGIVENEEKLKDVDEALMLEKNGRKCAVYMDYTRLSEDTKFKRLKR